MAKLLWAIKRDDGTVLVLPEGYTKAKAESMRDTERDRVVRVALTVVR